jgi:non-canonical purine NTP pyrophosphatase (RdgB/HAM1 family)
MSTTADKSQTPRRALYVTGNAGKFEEAEHVVRQLCPPENVLQLERVSVDLPELQGSAVEVAIAKTREAEKQLLAAKKLGGISFIITDDSGLGLSCLNGFPGVYIKAMLHSIGDVGIGKLAARYTDKAATATCTLGIIAVGGEHDVETFAGELEGSIISQPRGNVKHGSLSWNTVFVPAGETRTFGEIPMREHAEMSHRRHAFASFLASIGCLRPELSVQPTLNSAAANPAPPRGLSPASTSLSSPSSAVAVNGERVLLGGSGSGSSRALKLQREASDAKDFCAAWQSNAQVANWNTRWFKNTRGSGGGNGGGNGGGAAASASREAGGADSKTDSGGRASIVW